MADTQQPPAPQQIVPIDSLILQAFQRRFQQVFNCPCVWSNQHDKTAILQELFGQGENITYPYAWFVLTSVNFATNSYNSHSMGRRGLTFNVPNESHYQTVRIVPVNFEIEVYYTTNQYDSVGQGSIQSFIRRFGLARRFGYLKSSIRYGMMKFGIGTTLADQLTVPQRENEPEAETKYEIQAQLTMHGYISEPVVGSVGRIRKLNVQDGVQLPNGKIVSVQSLTFEDTTTTTAQTTAASFQGRNLARVRAKQEAKALAAAEAAEKAKQSG